jgi:hypothetical protein
MNSRLKSLRLSRTDVFKRISQVYPIDASRRIGHLPEFLDVLMNGINILYYVIHGSNGESFSLVYRAKCAVIPGTVTGNAYQQTVCLAGWSDGALFKSPEFCRVGLLVHEKTAPKQYGKA